MENELKTLTDTIIRRYDIWSSDRKEKAETDPLMIRVIDAQIKEFSESVRIEKGSKYTKVIVGTSVWGFIVNTDKHHKFKRGDILRAATWKAPAMNKARGNIIDGDFSWVEWTGPKYL